MVLQVTEKKETKCVGMGEIAVSKTPGAVLSCIGLGSCVAVCMYDAASKVGGVAHVVLPKYDGKPNDNLGKYADTAVPLLLEEMARCGSQTSRLSVKLAGGAEMCLARGATNIFKTGEKNVHEVMAALTKIGLRPAATDVGGNKGRTVRMFLDDGRMTIRILGGTEQDL